MTSAIVVAAHFIELGLEQSNDCHPDEVTVN
jgi:hypothetical protein